MFPSRYTNLDVARARFGDRVDRLGPYLDKVDPLGDAVVHAFAEMPAGRGWALLDQAIARGIAAVPEAPAALRALFAELDRVPPWVDWAVLDRGGELMMRAGPAGGMVLGARSIVLGYASPGGNKPLVFSGRLKDQAARRLNETSRFVQAVCRSGGMRRHADGFAITVKVRLMHAEVRRMIGALSTGETPRPAPGAHRRWDTASWGAPINQHDMAATILLFSVIVIDGLRLFGFEIEPDESEAYVQLWRYVGYLLGCDQELTPSNEFEGTRLGELIAATQAPPDEDARALTHALLHAGAQIAKTPGELRRARFQRTIAQGIMRALLGEVMADALGVPATPLRYALTVARQVNLAAERVRAHVPAAHRQAVEAGNRYWDRVVAIGLAGATAEFRAPERLAVSSASHGASHGAAAPA